MAPSLPVPLPRLNARFQRFFSPRRCQALWPALLLIIGAACVLGREVVQALQQALAQLRDKAGLGGHWRRNLVSSPRPPILLNARGRSPDLPWRIEMRY